MPLSTEEQDVRARAAVYDGTIAGGVPGCWRGPGIHRIAGILPGDATRSTKPNNC